MTLPLPFPDDDEPDDTDRYEPPPPTAELWLLALVSDITGKAEGGFCMALDTFGGPDGAMLCFESEDDAKEGAKYQEEEYGVECRPFQVK